MSEGQRILVIAPNWIGDALMAEPLIASLKRHDPTRHLTVLAPVQVAGVLGASGSCDEAIPTYWPHGGAQLFSRISFARRMRAEHFDIALILPNTLKAALIPFLAGIPKRVGYLGETRRGLLTDWLPPPAALLPMRERYLALAELIDGPGAMTQAPSKPQLRVTPDQIRAATSRFDIDLKRPLVTFCPGAEFGPAKRWPPAHFAKLAQLLRERDPTTQIVLLGGPNDLESAREIQSLSPQSMVSTVGQTSIQDALALLAASDLVFSNDSGLMHIAAALNRPQVAMFGSTDPKHTPPQSELAKVLWLQLPCSPCFERVCPLGHMRCLKELSPEAVLAASAPITVH